MAHLSEQPAVGHLSPGIAAALLGLVLLVEPQQSHGFGFLRRVQESTVDLDEQGDENDSAFAVSNSRTRSVPLTDAQDGAALVGTSIVEAARASQAALWHRDIFDTPPVEFLRNLLKNAPTEDWLILAATVVGLLLLDAFVLQPLASKRRGPLPREDKDLRAAFDQCKPSSQGQVSKVELIDACKRSAEARLHSLSLPGGGDTITWEEFRGTASPQTTGLGSSYLNGAILAFWVLVGGIFNAIIFYRRGEEAGWQWCSGYALEWLLSLDNLFVFHLIFRTYGTPRCLLYRALFLGIVGAVAFRMCFFLALTSLLHLVHWFRFVFGVLLIYSGVQAARGEDEDPDVKNTLAIRMLKRCLGSRLLESYDEEHHRLFLRGPNGQWSATLLVPVILCLEITDAFFAIDSVSAKIAQIPDYYIAYSSSIVAIFGLRQMFFVIQDMVDCFELLKYGLCFILVFIGIELMIADFVKLPAHVVCVVIVSVFIICAIGSVAQRLHAAPSNRQTPPQAAAAASS